jgi:hypothetical protein
MDERNGAMRPSEHSRRPTFATPALLTQSASARPRASGRERRGVRELIPRFPSRSRVETKADDASHLQTSLAWIPLLAGAVGKLEASGHVVDLSKTLIPPWQGLTYDDSFLAGTRIRRPGSGASLEGISSGSRPRLSLEHLPMKSSLVVAIALVAISVSALGQCSTLTVTGSINPGQTVTVDVSGAPANSATYLVVGDAGSTTIQFGSTTLTLGVDQPFQVFPLGLTDTSGHVSLSATVPSNVPANLIPNETFTLQAVTPTFTTSPPPGPPTPSITFCVSNTATLVSGTG